MGYAEQFDGKTMRDKVAVVTGAAGGIGQACAQEVLARGGKVLFTDLHISQEFKDQFQFEFMDGRVAFADGDVTNPEQLASVMQQAANMGHGKIHMLVNSAGIQIQAPLILEADAASKDGKPVMQTAGSFGKVIDINLKGAFNAIEAALPYMAAAGGGAVVNISSVHGHVGSHDRSPYCASKFGMMGMTRALAGDLARYGVRVNTADGWWLLRASNTQDVLVARAESDSDEGLERLIAQIDEQLQLSGLERGESVGH